MKTSDCRFCGKKITFLLTAKNRRMPCDLEGVTDNDTNYDSTKHVSHFITCKGKDKK